jgi:hypothetical protein
MRALTPSSDPSDPGDPTHLRAHDAARRRTGVRPGWGALIIRLVVVGALCFALPLLSACGAQSQAAAVPTNTTVVSVEGDYVGQIPTLNATIAITTDGSNVEVYLTDGTTTHASLSLWIQGPIANNIVTLTSPTVTLPSMSPTKIVISALVTPQSVSGTVTLQATYQTNVFTAEALTSQSGAPGLYQGSLQTAGASYLGGWYALPSDVAATTATPSGGAIMNEATGTVLTSPTPDFITLTVTVPGLGVFPLHRCHFGHCG